MTIIEFSDWLQERLDEREWKPKTLADKAKLAPSIISRALNRERLPNTDSLLSIAHALELPPDEIFRAAGILPPAPEMTELLQKAVYYISQLHPEDQKRVILYLEFLATRYQYGGERP